MSDPPIEHRGSGQGGSGQDPIQHEKFHGMGQRGQESFEAIAINTLQSLAYADAKEVEARLKATGYSPGLKKITDWISHAQALINEVSTAAPEPPTASSRLESPSATESPPEGEIAAEPSSPDTTPEMSEADSATAGAGVSDADDEIVAEPLTAEAPTDSPEAIGPDAADESELESPDSARSEDSDALSTDWTTFASFTVDFEAKQVDEDIRYQTSVRHVETDEVQTWQGIEETQLQAWMREHLAGAIPTVAALEASAATAVANRLNPFISDLRIFQPPPNPLPIELYQPSLMFPSPVKSNLPFTLELQFGIQEQDQEVLAQVGQAVTYTIECYARSLVGKEVVTLGKLDPQELQVQQRPYLASLPAISLPPGIFRLQLLLNLQGIGAFPAYFEVPVLQVD